jgi:hypothetical protein
MTDSMQKFERLKLILEQTGLLYFADTEKQLCLLRFGDLTYTDFDTIYLSLRGRDNDVIVATLTLLDGEKKYPFNTGVFEHCLKFNKNVGLLKTQFDSKHGDIDLSYETWLATLPEHLYLGIHLLASEGNELARELKSLCG